MKLPLPAGVKELAQTIQHAGHQCYLVGGAVRNLIAGHPESDFDFATSAEPQEITQIFRKVIPTGIDHGTVTVLFKNQSYEVTTFRSEGDYSDGRHPDAIQYLSEIDEDLHRRDFTINSMAYDPVSHQLLDPNGGQEDLKKGIIRAIGIPEERFQEDPLRQLRAFRFMGQLEYTIEPNTLKAIREHSAEILKVSAERIKDELDKLLKSPKPSQAFRAMEETGVLKLILPELAQCRGISQKGFHQFDVLDHSLLACDGAPPNNYHVRWAALLHDVGKVPSRKWDDQGIVTFHNHEQFSAQMAEDICRRYRFSNHDRELIVHLILNHMFHYEPETWTDAAVRRFIARSGIENLASLFALRRADHFGMNGIKSETDNLRLMRDHINHVLEEESALSLKDLKISGKDLKAAGVPPGPAMGVILRELLETVLDDPEMNQKESLLQIAKGLWEKLPSED